MSAFDWVEPVFPRPGAFDELGGLAPTPRGWDRLRFTMQHQVNTQWCWAATAVSFAEFGADHGWTQCSVAGATLRRADCCEDGGSACNRSYYLDQALATVGQFDRKEAGAANSAEIDSEIAHRRAIAIRVGWAKGGGHFIAITGISLAPTVMVAVNDPWYGPRDVTLDTFNGLYMGSGTWTHTYFTLKGR